jgi:hypothetical protein
VAVVPHRLLEIRVGQQEAHINSTCKIDPPARKTLGIQRRIVGCSAWDVAILFLARVLFKRQQKPRLHRTLSSKGSRYLWEHKARKSLLRAISVPD